MLCSLCLIILSVGNLNPNRDWNQFAEESGLSKAQTRKRIVGMAINLADVARQLQAAGAFVADPLVDEIVRLAEQRSAVTIRRLCESQ